MQRSLGWVALALTAIWIAVFIISVSSPDLIYGEDQNTFPIVPVVTWAWGAGASAFALQAFVQRHPNPDDQRYAWIGLAIAIVSIWTAVTIVALVLPTFVFEFGDTTFDIPLGQLLAPVAGTAATAVAGQYVPQLTEVAASVGRRSR